MINYIPALSEIFVLIMVCVTLLLSVYLNERRYIAYYCVQFTLVFAAILTWYSAMHSVLPVVTFSDTFVLDKLSVVLKEFIYLTAFVSFLYSRQYNELRNIPRNEFYVLGLLSVLGMMVLVSSNNFITLYLGLELFSLPIYAMVALQRDLERCIEAALKYFVMGSLASGLLLYGLSMLFGVTHSLDIPVVAKVIATVPMSDHMILMLGLVFILAGVAFKLGAAPFHQWVPDVYDGAPTSMTLFISAAPKIAAFGLLIRLLVDSMPALSGQWHQVVIVIAILSMGIGNLTAIAQTSIKRMLAYSSVAHMGYMLLGIACATQRGEAAALFYMLSYSIMTLVAFGVVILLSRSGFEADKIKDLSGLNSRNPWFAFVMLLTMFSMAGVPPIVGFIAKVGVLEALIQVHMVWLAVVALLFAIVGAYYYLRVVKVMYFEEAEKQHEAINCGFDTRLILSLNGIAVVMLGIFPGVLFALCHSIHF